MTLKTLAAGCALGVNPALAQTTAPTTPPVDPRPRSYDLIGQKAPATDLARLDGGRFTNKDFIGKTTIVQFWGIWCPDCLADVDDVAALNRLIKGDKKLRFIGIHTRGRYGRWGGLEPFFTEKNYRFPVAIDDDSAAYKAWQIKWVPSFVIVGPDGTIRDYTTDLKAGSGIGVAGLIAKARGIAKANQSKFPA
ncbi:TlpA family protein disulfide reductase [Candidatus Phycosocius spiralis]|nr:TlpA disulfide reductase family protein [Candidatus Phycosocius spiralis]